VHPVGFYYKNSCNYSEEYSRGVRPLGVGVSHQDMETRRQFLLCVHWVCH